MSGQNTQFSVYETSRVAQPNINEPQMSMTNPTKWHVRPAKTQISQGIHPVWSEPLLSAWELLGS